jgi:hypothetical protein
MAHQKNIWLEIVSKAYGEEASIDAKDHELRGAKTVIDIMEKAGFISKERVKQKIFVKPIENTISFETYKNLVFVIMAIAPDMEPIFKGIENAAKKFDLEAKRVVDVEDDIRITDEIIKMINEAEIIVADLTLERQNVYFELGYARGKNKKIITLARKGTVVHFDVKDWKYIPYTDSSIVEQELVKRFQHLRSEIYEI